MKIKFNPDPEIVNTIKEGLKRTGGYCPCRRERTEATKCMCQEFKDQIADPGFEGFCQRGASPAVCVKIPVHWGLSGCAATAMPPWRRNDA